MVLLDQKNFLVSLDRLFEKTKTTGTVFLTTKRYYGKLKKGEKKDSIPDRQYPCLVRATVGKKTISTLVNPADLFHFQANYAMHLRLKMNSLKKKEKSKRTKPKKPGQKTTTTTTTTTSTMAKTTTKVQKSNTKTKTT